MSAWTTPQDLREQLQKLWRRGRLLGDSTLFPLRLPLRTPAAGDLGARFDRARDWVQNWAQEEAQEKLTLEWREINSRDIGRNRLPAAVLFETRDSALAFIGKRREGRKFDGLRRQILGVFPQLGSWVEQRPIQALELEAHWPRLLAVVGWLRDHPRPGVYIRQLELPGVDTKFVESHKKVLMELLDRVLDTGQINEHARGVAGFESRYGFRAKPAQIRFRLLDPELYLHGLGDLQVPVADFARLDLPIERVFITENDINGLAFPAYPSALVIFGLGYGLDSLKDAPWLADLPLHYWGDIDTHGFAMLDQLRGYFPQVQAMLMDRGTLLAHEALWGSEARPTHKRLPHLNAEESALYEDLCLDRIAPALRLEQERIGYDHVRRVLRTV
jgi:hypothetical protein